MQSRPLRSLRQVHLVRLRHACRHGPGEDSPGTALHVPLIDTRPPTRTGFAYKAGSWPLRRLAAVAVLSPLLFVLLTSVAGGLTPGATLGWTALVALTALAGAATLATYLPRPGAGRTLEIGCTPCAAVAALSVLGAAVVLSTSPHDVSTAFLALVIVGFGLTQRLTNPSTCGRQAPVRRGPGNAR